MLAGLLVLGSSGSLWGQGPGDGGPGDRTGGGVVKPAPQGVPSGGGSGDGSGASGTRPVPLTGAGSANEPGTGAGVLDEGARIRLASELDDSSWFGWWERRQDPYLMALRPRWTLADGDRTGHGGGGVRVSEAELVPVVSVQRSVIPALLAFLEEEPGSEAERRTLLALARLPAAPDQARRIEALLTEAVGKRTPRVAASAIVALGVRGSQESAPLLLDLAADGPLGRRLRSGSLPVDLRATAALAAGILAARTENVDVSAHVAKRLLALALDRRADEALRIASLVGTGAAAERSQHGAHAAFAREEWVLQLSHLLESQKESDPVRGRAAVCLARVATALESRESQAQILGLLLKSADSRQPQSLRQGAVSALVLLVTQAPWLLNRDVLGVLERASKKGPLECRGPAWIGLARLSAQSGRSQLVERVARDIAERLGRASAPERGWCALALGLQSAELLAAGAQPSPLAQKALGDAFEDERAAEVRAALGLASALSQCSPRGKGLRQRCREGEDLTRAWSAFALGASLGPAVREELMDLLRDARHAPGRMGTIADALRLQGAGSVVLAEFCRSGCCQATTVAAAAALGRSGDPLALEPLLALLRDADAGGLQRAAAAAALGRLGDRHPLRLAHVLVAGVDQAAGLGALYNGSGTGALQVR